MGFADSVGKVSNHNLLGVIVLIVDERWAGEETNVSPPKASVLLNVSGVAEDTAAAGCRDPGLEGLSDEGLDTGFGSTGGGEVLVRGTPATADGDGTIIHGRSS
jgi:hypothetical protein